MVRSALADARRDNERLNWGFVLVPGSIPEVKYRHLSVVTAGGEQLPLSRVLVEPALSMGIQWLGGRTIACIHLPEALYGHPRLEPLPYVQCFVRVGPSPQIGGHADAPIDLLWDADTVDLHRPVLLLEERPRNWPR